MNLEFSNSGGVLVARVLDRRIDAQAAGALRSQIGAHIAQGTSRIVLDLTDVDFIASTGLGAILSLLKHLAPSGNMVLCGCQPAVLELMRLTRLDRVFRLCATQAEAQEALG
jgi:anti-sigma B factor antagonist